MKCGLIVESLIRSCLLLVDEDGVVVSDEGEGAPHHVPVRVLGRHLVLCFEILSENSPLLHLTLFSKTPVLAFVECALIRQVGEKGLEGRKTATLSL